MDTGTAHIGRQGPGRERKDREFTAYMRYSLHGDDEIEGLVREIQRQVSRRVDCRRCGNCCRDLRPAFTDRDIARLARREKLSRGAFIEKYLAVHDDGRRVLRESPCPFLVDGLCVHYTARPEACRDYPRIGASSFTARVARLMENREICPIVSGVYEGLRTRLRRRP